MLVHLERLCFSYVINHHYLALMFDSLPTQVMDELCVSLFSHLLTYIVLIMISMIFFYTRTKQPKRYCQRSTWRNSNGRGINYCGHKL